MSVSDFVSGGDTRQKSFRPAIHYVGWAIFPIRPTHGMEWIYGFDTTEKAVVIARTRALRGNGERSLLFVFCGSLRACTLAGAISSFGHGVQHPATLHRRLLYFFRSRRLCVRGRCPIDLRLAFLSTVGAGSRIAFLRSCRSFRRSLVSSEQRVARCDAVKPPEATYNSRQKEIGAKVEKVRLSGDVVQMPARFTRSQPPVDLAMFSNAATPRPAFGG